MPHQTFGQSLNTIGAQYSAAIPDLREFAREQAALLIKKHTGQTLDPDQVWWHAFDNAQSNNQSFNGREHRGPPQQSVTLTDLVIKRFAVRDEVNAIDLDQMTGFYQAGPEAGLYDQQNQVAMSVVDVLNDFWALDFKGTYLARLATFREQEAENGRVLLKAAFITSAWSARSKYGPLSTDVFKLLVNTLWGPTRFPFSLQDLRNSNTLRQYAEVRTFTLGALTAVDMLLIRNSDGLHILYAADGWYMVFQGLQEAYDWLREEAADAESRRHLITHFVDPHNMDETARDQRKAFHATLDALRATAWSPTQTHLQTYSKEVKSDVFSYLFNRMLERLQGEVRAVFDNRDLRKRLWLVDLAAFTRITSGLAPLAPQVALLAAASTALSLGGHMALAVHGVDRAERHQAWHAALTDAVLLLLDGAQLYAHQSTAARAFADLDEPVLANDASVAAGETAVADNPLLQAMAVDLELDAASLGNGRDAGVHVFDSQHRYIAMQGHTYQVSFVEGIEQWVVVDPLEPQRLAGAWPVVRNWRGRWEPHVELEVEDGIPLQPVQLPVLEAHRLSVELNAFNTSARYDNLIEQLVGRDGAELMSAALGDGSPLLAAREQLRGLRQQLAQQSSDFFLDPPAIGRWKITALDADTSAREFFDIFFASGDALVISETRSGLGGKRLLIDYMARLKAAGVRTIYVEHLLKDLHQPALDHFWLTGDMPLQLTRRFRQIRAQLLLDQHEYYSHQRLLKEARRHGIRLQALDCAASLASDGLPAQPGLARRLRLFYAMQRINAQRVGAPKEKWIALTEDIRASAAAGEPGLAELTGAAHLRVRDLLNDEAAKLTLDSGELSGTTQVQGDVRLELGVQRAYEMIE